jgi:hypothetical protein
MELARFTTGSHNPNCSGCPACSEHAAQVYASANQGLQVSDSRVFRTTSGSVPDPPNFLEAIRKSRSQPSALRTAEETARLRAFLTPPPPSVATMAEIRTAFELRPAPLPPDFVNAIRTLREKEAR